MTGTTTSGTSSADARQTAGLTPYGLSCEMLPTPLGIDEPRPRLSWKLASPRRGDVQTAYRLRVVRDADDLDDPARALWDTGWTDSSESVHHTYDGPWLESSTRYHWRVEVRDSTGAATAHADSWFETALLHPSDWAAVWIAHDPVHDPLVDPPQDNDRSQNARRLAPVRHMRTAFALDSRPTRARAYVSARGLYELRLNGERVGDAELAPGWTEYHHRVLYQCYDVTTLARHGENVLGGLLAEGWFSGFVGSDAQRPARHYGDAPQLLVQVVLDFADGSRRVVATDGTWRERDGSIRFADLLMGEYVDARAELTGWDRPGYDDTGWHPVLVADQDTSVLEATPDQPVRVVQELSPLSVERRPDGTYLVDLGQNMVGRVRLTVRGAEPGRRIQLRHAEMLDDEGGLYVTNLRRAEATDVYLARGEGAEVFEPRFTFHGFRYVEVANYPGELRPDDVTGRVLASDTPWTGSFRCSDDTVNRLQANIRWGQAGNFLSVPTDCPQRDERLGWVADAQIFTPTACRNADVSAFLARWMRDVVDGQDADGAFGDVAPRVTVMREGAPAWGDGGVIIPWHLYRVYGDVRVLERSFDAMTAWVEHVHRHNPDLIWRHRGGNQYGDWLQVDAVTPREVLATAYFARSAQLVAAAAGVLGRAEQQQWYADLHAAVADAFVREFVDDDGHVHGGTQTAYLLALAFELLPEHLAPKAFEHLVADVEKRDRHLTTGFVGVALLCPVLAAHGRPDLAYALLHQDTYPSWAYSIAHGATTIWERWDGWTEEHGFQSAAMNSFNHYSLGSVGEWLYGGVAGIDQAPDSVAYRHLVLRPTVGGGLAWASGEQETPRGRVASGWRLADGVLTLDVEIPPGASARLYVPTPDPDSVREGGRIPVEDEGVQVVRPAPGDVLLALQSGRFTVTAAAPHVT
jgi:alpha-L-rhamnosidase